MPSKVGGKAVMGRGAGGADRAGIAAFGAEDMVESACHVRRVIVSCRWRGGTCEKNREDEKERGEKKLIATKPASRISR